MSLSPRVRGSLSRALVGGVVMLATLGARHGAGPTVEQYIHDIRYLASPALHGRLTGSPDLHRAAEFLARRFRRAGWQPAQGTSFYQDFSVTTEVKRGLGNRLRVQQTTDGPAREVAADQFVPFNFSSTATVTAPVVFAGYGITAPEYGYDDYAGIDVQGKLVLLLRHEPQEGDDRSVFAGRVFTGHSQLASKASNAKQHGAVGVLLVNDLLNHSGDPLEPFAAEAGPGNAGIPFVQTAASVANEWLAGQRTDVRKLEESIDERAQPHSLALPETLRVTVKTDLRRVNRTAHNVVAYLPGTTDEYVVIGAHYDHLGRGRQFSLAPAQAGTVHPGADDNASGTAGLLYLAESLAAQPRAPRGVLLIAFAGEELGLLGSSYYVNHPLRELGQAVAMLNMDMIGRIGDHRVYVSGLGSGSTLNASLDTAAADSPLHLDRSDKSPYGSSDHTSFLTKRIPVLFFFSGLHADYHKPSDTWDKINGPDAVQLLELVGKLTRTLQGTPERPAFVSASVAMPSHGVAEPGQPAVGGTSGYGPAFGSVPDFGESGQVGVRFADVRPGSPADRAGLKAGDVLVQFAGKKVDNLEDFTYLLRKQKAGDVVRVRVLRAGQPLEADVTLAERK